MVSSERVWERFLPQPPGNGVSVGSAWTLAGKSVLVTGAGGFIGSALVKVIAAVRPRVLVLLDSSEGNLFEIQRFLEAAFPHVPCQAVLGSVENAPLLDQIFSRFRPETTFHAAAFKHVPLLEGNPFSAVRNNALGTHALAQAARRHGSEKFVLISTDKAVNPHSIMGASKRIAELITVSLSGPACRMNAVRLVNVIGSSGSVVPLFWEQIEKRGPVLATHPQASRYFLSLSETLNAILACGASACDGRILLSEAGEPVRIVELAQFLIKAMGNGSGTEIPILFTGLRPGDKLTEDLISSKEKRNGFINDALTEIETQKLTPAQITEIIKDLSACTASHDLTMLMRIVSSIVPEYMPSRLLLDTVTLAS